MLCRVCKQPAHQLCSRCGVARYCTAECQRADWPTHKTECSPQTHAPQKDLDRIRARAAQHLADERLVGTVQCRGHLPQNQAEFDRRLAKCDAVESHVEMRSRLYAHLRERWAHKLKFIQRKLPDTTGDVFWYYVLARIDPATGPFTSKYAHVFFCRGCVPRVLFCKILAGGRNLMPAEGTFSFFLRKDDVLFGGQQGKLKIDPPLLCKFDPRPPDEIVDWDSGRKACEDYQAGRPTPMRKRAPTPPKSNT